MKYALYLVMLPIIILISKVAVPRPITPTEHYLHGIFLAIMLIWLMKTIDFIFKDKNN